MRERLVAFATRLNTHRVALLGLASVVFGALADPTVLGDLEALRDAILSLRGQPFTWVVGVRLALRVLILAGGLASYLGRPKTIPA